MKNKIQNIIIETFKKSYSKEFFYKLVSQNKYETDEVKQLVDLSVNVEIINDLRSNVKLTNLIKEELNSLLQIQAQNSIDKLRIEIEKVRPKGLEIFGKKYFSQTDEDGIISEIFKRIGTTNKYFFEFGVGAGIQNNTVALLCSNWSGAWIECNIPKYHFIEANYEKEIATNKLKLDKTFLTINNIISTTNNLNIPIEFDFLSVDVDGNDYWLIDKILENYKPRVMVLEYNGNLPSDVKYVQPYQEDYQYHPKSYLGCSLEALNELCEKYEYILVGTGIIGINCFYVKKEYANLFQDAGNIDKLKNIPKYNLDLKSAFSAGPQLNARRLLDSQR